MPMNIPNRNQVDTTMPCDGGGEGYFLGVGVRPDLLELLPGSPGYEPPRRGYPDYMENESPEDFIQNLRLVIADPTLKGLDVIHGHIGTDHDDAEAGEKLRNRRGAALHELLYRYVFVDEPGTQAQPAADFGVRTAIDLNSGNPVPVLPEQAVVNPRGNPGYVIKVDEMTQIVHPSQLRGNIDFILG